MKHLMIFLAPLFLSCSDQPADNSESNEPQSPFKFLQQTLHDEVREPQDSTPRCPKDHTDSIIPIEYGYPSEEMFAQADSGLIMLGGCEIGEEQYYCTKHDIAF